MVYTWNCILPLLFGSGRLAKTNFWFGNFTKSIIWYLIKYCIFANQKRMCVIRMKRKNQNKQPVWRNTWNICIASHSQSFPRRTFLVEIICRFVPKTQNLRTDKSMSNHEERIYNSICINSHMKYKYCITFVNNIEWLSHLCVIIEGDPKLKFCEPKTLFLMIQIHK